MATINNIVKFAAKFLNMAKLKGKDKKKATAKAKPVKAKSKPVVKKAVKAKPVAKKKTTAKPAAKKVKAKAKPVATAAKKNTAKKAAKPAIAKTVKRNTVSSVNKKAVKQINKPQPKPKPATVKPRKNNTGMEDLNLRYSDQELKEFKDIIDSKLVTAREESRSLKEALDNHTESQAGNKAWNMEEGTDTSEMEYLMNQISRQQQYIRNLELALVRIKNKTYGICRVSGKLIPKERLRVVPHATLSLEAKNSRKNEEETPATTGATPPIDFSERFED